MVEANRSGIGGSICLIVIGIILILAALVFYFIKNINYFAITIIAIGVITVILGLVLIFYTQTRDLKTRKNAELGVVVPVAGIAEPLDDSAILGVKKSKNNNFEDIAMLSVVRGTVPKIFNAEAVVGHSKCADLETKKRMI